MLQYKNINQIKKNSLKTYKFFIIFKLIMSQVNVLFYSNHCPGSQALITLMKNEGLLRFFHQILTDNNPNLPPQIRVTPTLMIRNIPTPYVAGDAFNWLNKIKQWKINEQMKRVSNMQQSYLQQMSSNLNGGENMDSLSGFSREEMAGMSDIFAYLMDENALRKTYVDYSNLGKERIFTPPVETNNKNEIIKINGTQHANMHKKMIESRKKQDLQIKKNIEDFANQMR